jgi:hypothetical protein
MERHLPTVFHRNWDHNKLTVGQSIEGHLGSRNSLRVIRIVQEGIVSSVTGETHDEVFLCASKSASDCQRCTANGRATRMGYQAPIKWEPSKSGH